MAKKDSPKARNAKNERNIVTKVVSRFGLRIIIYAALIIIFYVGIMKAYHYGYSVFTSDPVAAEPGQMITVTIAKDMSDKEIGELLQKEGLIEDGSIFVIHAKMFTSEKYKIQPGTYELYNSWTDREIVEAMSALPETEEETTALAVTPSTEETNEDQSEGNGNGQ